MRPRVDSSRQTRRSCRFIIKSAPSSLSLKCLTRRSVGSSTRCTRPMESSRFAICVTALTDRHNSSPRLEGVQLFCPSSRIIRICPTGRSVRGSSMTERNRVRVTRGIRPSSLIARSRSESSKGFFLLCGRRIKRIGLFLERLQARADRLCSSQIARVLS